MNFLGFGQSAEIDIVFDGADTRKTAEVKAEDGKMEKYLLYYDGETVSGKVNVTLKKPGSKLEHQGIKIEFIGQIELFYDRGNHHEFKAIVKALARPGDLIHNSSYPFEFPNVEKSFEVYAGSNVRLRYFLRATIVRRLSDITREVDIAVHTLCSYPDLNNPIKMEVGIEDCLHIEFEYNKSKYHLKDVIVGKIYFLLVRIKIKHMEIAIIKRESTGSGPNMFTENETIAKYEIMDGAPVKGESIPIRVFLAGYSLTPTMRDINKKFSVKYFLNLVLMDTEDRRYFKQQEITLWRKADKSRKSQSIHSGNHPHAPTHLVGSGNMDSGLEGDLQSRYGIVGNMTNTSMMGGGERSAIAATIEGGTDPIGATSIGHDNKSGLISGIPGPYQPGAADSKMGLFTRESPQQEFNRHEEITPTTPPGLRTIVATSSSADMLRGTADGAVSSSAQIDGAAAAQTLIDNSSSAAAGVAVSVAATPLDSGSSSSASASHLFETPRSVMVSITPPPLPTAAENVEIEDKPPLQFAPKPTARTTTPSVPLPLPVSVGTAASAATRTEMIEEMINVPLSPATTSTTTDANITRGDSSFDVVLSAEEVAD